LLIVNNKLSYKRLLNINILGNLFWNSALYLQSLRMWLCPYKTGIYEFYSFKTFNLS
jgi:hypothetical protein